jgi:DNA replication protein DnaC
MSDTTSIGDQLDHLAPQFRIRTERECEEHPGSRAGECQTCDREQRDAADRGERDAVLAEAERAREEFPPRFREVTTDLPEIVAWAAQFRADPAAASSLLLLGPTGTGKTHNAYGAVAAAVVVAWPRRLGNGYRKPRWQALTHADLCAALRPRGRDYDPEAELKRFRDLDLLMVDDLGAAKSTEFVEEATYRLVNGRYEDMRPSIFTSNLAPGELRGAVGDRIASRLVETCVRVVLDGPDRRRMARAA